MDFPLISTNGFPGNRVEAYRAGMIPVIFMCQKVKFNCPVKTRGGCMSAGRCM